MANQNKPTAFGDYMQGPATNPVVRVDPTVKAVARKLIANPLFGRSFGYGKKRTLNTDPSGLLSRIANRTTSNIIDARNAMRLLPEIELAMSILVSSILSPKDMNTIEITYSQRERVVRSETAQSMLDVIRTHFETHHKLKDFLTPMLEDSLFKTGSYPMLVLAENTIDTIINGQQRVNMESFATYVDSSQQTFKHLGYLGTPGAESTTPPSSFDVFGLESWNRSNGAVTYDPNGVYLKNTQIVDNPNILKLPMIRDRIRSDTVRSLMNRARLNRGVSTESDQSEARELVGSLYRTPQYQAEPFITVPTTGSVRRPTAGHPLVMKLPSESVIPVHEPSNPTKHLGYFILIDRGSPVYRSLESDYASETTALYNGNQSLISSILTDANRIQNGLQRNYNSSDVRQLEMAYGDLIEYELNQRLMRGVYGSGATVARAEEVYRVMLTRALQGKQNQLLYVPEEMLTYIAFDYDENGVGISLLQKSMALAAQLANLSVASTLAELKNSISRTKLNITLDEEDQDPSGTVEHIFTEFAKLRRGNYPMQVFPPTDIVNMLQNAAIDIEVNGNTGYPNTKVEVSDYNSNKVLPNPEFQKTQRDRLIWSFGLPPELIDTSRGADFATSVVNNHLLMIKNVMHYQQTLTPMLEHFVRTYILSDGQLLAELKEILTNAKTNPMVDDIAATPAQAKDAIGGSKGEDVDRQLVDFLMNLQIDLPKPEGAKQADLKQAYLDHKEFLESAVASWISEDAVAGELLGELSGKADMVQKALVSVWMRQWCRENGMAEPFDELMNIGENDAAGFDLFAEIQAHSSPILVNLRDFLIKQVRRTAADDKVLNTVKDQTGNDDLGSSSGSSDTSSNDDGGGGDDFGGGGSDDGFGSFDSVTGGEEEDGQSGGEASGEESSETSESSTTETNADGSTTTTTSSSQSSSSSSAS